MSEEIDTTEIDIAPKTSVYSTFEKLSYEQNSAYAEFIDNSTQSYFDHKEKLDALPDFESCVIKINHDKTTNTIVVEDNCFGMEIEDFRRAIILNSVPDITTGRNEFGMGLKTAATWFGKKWTVRSTQYGSNDEYEATIDIDSLKKYKSNTLKVKIRHVPCESHYTVITISNLNKKYPAGRGMGKIRESLSSVYSRDIMYNNVQIYYNDEQLKYELPAILECPDKNGEMKKWKKDIDFEIKYDGNTYPVKGFVAIRQTSSGQYAGFQLFRRNRVVVGGFGERYKPELIFGQPQGFKSIRIFGEFDLDNWPVSQAKDKLAWDSDLEDLFINGVHDRIRDIEKMASEYRVRRPQPPLPPNEPGQGEGVGPTTPPQPPLPPNEPGQGEGVGPTTPPQPKTSKKYSVAYNGDVYNFDVSYKKLNADGLFSKSSEKYNFNITINTNNPLAKSCSDDPKSMSMLTKFIMYLVISEKNLVVKSSDGSVSPESIRNQFNLVTKANVKEIE